MRVNNPDWTEKHRPSKIDDIVLPDKLKGIFNQFIIDGNIPNMALAGKPGTGKTTAARALMDQMGCDYIIINSSKDGNIDVLRNKMMNFASSVSFGGGRKMILLDEADNLNLQSTQPALRNFIETYSSNCLDRTTKIITLEYGPIEIGKINGKEVTIKCKDGLYRKTKIKSYGNQDLYEFQFGKFNSSIRNIHQTVIATKDHRWFLSDGTITTSLKIGDKLLNAPAEVKKDNNGIIHGIIFGDGSGHKSKMRGDVSYVRPQGNYASIRVCKQDKVQSEIIEHLHDAGYEPRYPKHTNGDPVYNLGFFPYIKDLPHTNDPEYIAGFIHGWWLADGKKDNRERLIISTINQEAVNWLKEYASYAGYKLTGLNVREAGKGGYKNSKALYNVTLSNKEESCVRKIKYYGNDEVFCLEEPVTTGFVLSNGLLTGNCGFILTCNYKKKLMPELLSRMTTIDFNIKKSDRPKMAMGYLESLCNLLDKEGVKYDKKVLSELIIKMFPDFRKVIHTCQFYASSGDLNTGILSSTLDTNFSELVGYLKTKNWREMRKWVVENYDADPLDIMRKIYDDTYSLMSPISVEAVVLVLAEYQYKHQFVVDQEINLVACLTEIMREAIWK